MLAKGERSLVVELPDRAVRHDRRTAEHTAWAEFLVQDVDMGDAVQEGPLLRVPERAFDAQPLLNAHGPQTLETEPLPG